MRISAYTRAQAVTNAADTLHVALPPAYVEQFAEAEAFAEAAKQTVYQKETLHRVVLDAIQEGRDYLSDRGIQAMALNAQLTDGNILAAARSRAEQLRFAALRDHAGDILDGWADALDEHSAKLAAAADAGVNLNDADGAVARGGAAMTHLHNAQVAIRAWNTATNGFYALAAVSGVRNSADSATVLTPARLAELAPAYEMARDERAREVGVWILARCGLPLRLADLDEFKSRAAQLKHDAEAEARSHAARANAAGFNRR
ncbi:aldehyde dehydrogenase [Mycolicibacterium sp. OfavD-34-C]|uniref:aldehyde dehydrogenase n=1 Tax=Mycolicibacterium sp. OfavD-34-C TaxID=2917746 RepID=UPI001EF5DFE0|nr:aldehyde dehydrogenase [Mycolicibacterium sp. OfavD-34-C]MCG7582798.1 aldehyde dehydrogenase [Mycolicibacterium sp. OfavD-34-C]